jgi:two-component system copper resistance phosphate regulon response regulator CusR
LDSEVNSLARSLETTSARIQIVDDDDALRTFLSRELTNRQFVVEVSRDGEAACATLREAIPDLLILDLNLPLMDGMAVLKSVRANHPLLPVLVLTARNRREDMLSALEHGADDCLIKPFSFLELLARVKSLLRRNSAPSLNASSISNLSISREEHCARRGDRRIELTPREFSLLDYLITNAGKTLSRGTLMQEVWGSAFDSSTNIVDVYMKYLRDKIDGEGEAKLIRTVRGVGYALTND